MSREDSAIQTDPSGANGTSRVEDLEACGPPRPTTPAHIIQDDQEALISPTVWQKALRRKRRCVTGNADCRLPNWTHSRRAACGA